MVPNQSSLLLFTSAALLLLVMPGPAVFYIVGRSIALGRRAGLVSVLGIAVGTLVHVTAATVGLSALLLSSATAFATMKYLGAVYLIYLGVQRLRHMEIEPSRSIEQVKLGRVFGQGVVVNVLNPKAALFFFAFLPQFVDTSRGRTTAQILFLGLLFTVMGVVSDSVWALFAGSVAERLRVNLRWNRAQRVISGGILISLGVTTAFAGSKGK